MVGPAAKREAGAHLQTTLGMSERRACLVVGADRTSMRYRSCRAIGDNLTARGVKLQLGASIHDPLDPMRRMFFNILATFAEFEADAIQMWTRKGMAVARAKGKPASQAPKAVRSAAERALPDARHR